MLSQSMLPPRLQSHTAACLHASMSSAKRRPGSCSLPGTWLWSYGCLLLDVQLLNVQFCAVQGRLLGLVELRLPGKPTHVPPQDLAHSVLRRGHNWMP